MTARVAAIGRRLRDARGVSAVEFALIAPVFLFVIMGGLEIGYGAYIQAVMEGEMQSAARARTMETATTQEQRDLVETRVRAAVHNLAPGATVTFKRTAYRDYAGATSGKEPFKDANGNGRCDANEVYEDLNNNGTWDATGAADNDGGARDVVMYVATVDYDLLPTGGLLNWGRSGKLQARTAMRNQPFDQQAPVTERVCK